MAAVNYLMSVLPNEPPEEPKDKSSFEGTFPDGKQISIISGHAPSPHLTIPHHPSPSLTSPLPHHPSTSGTSCPLTSHVMHLSSIILFLRRMETLLLKRRVIVSLPHCLTSLSHLAASPHLAALPPTLHVTYGACSSQCFKTLPAVVYDGANLFSEETGKATAIPSE